MEFVRGPQQSPIIFVGDSLPANERTRESLREVLDRRHLIYNSIIIPIKYYINEHLLDMEPIKYRLPKDRNNDIFRYINAIEDSSNKYGIDFDSEEGQRHIARLKNELLDNTKSRYKVIICLGDFSYFAVRAVFDKYNPRESHHYPKQNCKYSIKRLGEFFNEEISEKRDYYILPILHNSSNRQFERTDDFIPIGSEDNYVCYLQYIGKSIASLIVEDNELRKYLKEVKKL